MAIHDTRSTINDPLLVMCYVAAWAAPQGWTFDDIDWKAVTHVIDTFAVPDNDGNISIHRQDGNTVKERLAGKKLVGRAHAEKTYCNLSFGGAKGSEGFGNSSKKEKLPGFIDNIIRLVDDYGYDGVDIDWEFPSAAQKEDFMALMRGLYARLKNHSRKAFDGTPLQLTFFTTAGLYDAGVDWGKIGEHIDFAIQSGYEWDNPYNGPLRNTGKYTAESGFEIENSIHGFASGVIDRGLPASKFILGLPFYGSPGKVRYHDIVNEGEFLGYDALQAEARYLHRGIVQYVNTPEAFADKISYVRQQGRPGIAMWQATNIFPDKEVWKAIKQAKEEK